MTKSEYIELALVLEEEDNTELGGHTAVLQLKPEAQPCVQ